MNDLSNNFDPEPTSLKYGIVITHAWIRVFEFVVNLSIKLPVKVWQARGEKVKAIIAKREQKLKEKFWSNFGLKINQPRPNGAGNSNNGNTSRRAFQDPQKLATILELEFTLVNNLRTILVSLSCQLCIDPVKFNDLCMETAKFYIDKYSWYYMPATVHTILFHGSQIMVNSPLPVGMYGEEGLEASNKVNKNNRNFHSRKDSRLHSIEDMFNRAMDGSDPLISSIRVSKMKKPKEKILPQEVLELLLTPTEDSEQNDDETLEIQQTFYNELDQIELDNIFSDEEIE
jgi:hypothetical protein